MDYDLGKKVSSWVVSFDGNDLIVDLENGEHGRIPGGRWLTTAGIGENVNAVIKQVNGNEVILQLAADSFIGNKMRKNWSELPAGHGQAMEAIMCLRNHAGSFQNALTDVRNEWEKAKEDSQATYDSVSSTAIKQFEAEKSQFEKECKRLKDETSARSDIPSMINTVCDSIRGHLREDTTDSLRASMNSMQGSMQAVTAAIKEKINAYEELYNLYITNSERTRNDKLNKARTEQIDRDTQAEKRFNAKRNQLCENYRMLIEKEFNKDDVQKYQAKINASRFKAANYECPSDVPEYIMLGEIGLSIPDSTSDNIAVVQAVDQQANSFSKKFSGEYVVQIPYAQRLSDGISLLMRYSPSERTYAQNIIQPLLIKLFMSFPAGKLEATMIDPLELGASFPDIPKLAEGPNSARIIDTKIWSKEKDIENAIATLRQRLENITQSYGTDQDARLKKETIRALAITDFPVGFTETALKDLNAIVRNSASLGVCVLICANDEELEKLKSRNGALVSEIAHNVVETKVSGDRLMLTGKEYEHVFIQPDRMDDVLTNKNQILQLISSEIEHTPIKTEYFDSMFDGDIYDSNNWFTGNHEEIAVPIGIKGAGTVVKMILGRGGGNTEHHALIAGLTGAGKSTLLHTLILSTMISYSPEEVQMYLLDFKEGLEFGAYTKYRLPSLRVVAINSEREFGLTVLRELCNELENRTKYFSRYGVTDISSYAKLEAPKVPKLMLIFDEVQELFRSGDESDSISRECLSCLNKLVMQGRAMGIHIILACQDFHNCEGLEKYFSQMVIRIAVKGTVEGASSILNADNKGINTLQNQPAGAAIYNNGGGVESANNFFQVSYMPEEDRLNLLEHLDAYFTDPIVAPLYKNQQTRVLLTNAEDNINNCFNQLILYGSDSIAHLGTSKDGYGLLLGLGYGRKSQFIPEMRRNNRDNLLVVTEDEKVALSLFELSAMSVLYEELHTGADKSNALIYVVDLLDAELSDDECDFEYLESQFPQQVRTAKIGEAAELIESLYQIVSARAEGNAPSGERIFLLFFGINRARLLRNRRNQPDGISAVSPVEMLKKVFVDGPQNGVNSIVWTENIHGIEFMLGEEYESMFDKRIAYGLDQDSMDILVAENNVKALRGKTAVYMDIGRDVKNTHFRPYEVPAKVWVEKYAETYDEIVQEEGSL